MYVKQELLSVSENDYLYPQSQRRENIAFVDNPDTVPGGWRDGTKWRTCLLIKSLQTSVLYSIPVEETVAGCVFVTFVISSGRVQANSFGKVDEA